MIPNRKQDIDCADIIQFLLFGSRVFKRFTRSAIGKLPIGVEWMAGTCRCTRRLGRYTGRPGLAFVRAAAEGAAGPAGPVASRVTGDPSEWKHLSISRLFLEVPDGRPFLPGWNRLATAADAAFARQCLY